jgi:hypothetical protein
MKRTWIDDTMGCTDCYLAAAGVWTPTDWQPDPEPQYIPLTKLDLTDWAEPGWAHTENPMGETPDDDEKLGFYNSPCYTCASPYAGDRYKLSIWTKESE